MKNFSASGRKRILLCTFALITLWFGAETIFLASCASGSGSGSKVQQNIIELENKGTVMGIGTPNWVKVYLDKGVSALQEMPEYSGKYCIVGEESGVNKQFVLSWADAASAQQRIGSLIRTNVASRYEAFISSDAVRFSQEIDFVVSALINVSYSGAQREADWWTLQRKYDIDSKENYTDEYTALVFYTVPREELNRQVALALETSVAKDSALYDITIALARDILLQGYDENERHSALSIQTTAGNNYDPPQSLTARALNQVDFIDEYAVGRDVAAAILSNYKIVNNQTMTAYINKILLTLVINSPKPSSYNGYHAAVLDSDTVNAFASPGGHIFLTRGLIMAAKSEDALAAVIAHELSHIQLRHGMRAIQSSRDTDDWLRQFMFSGGQIIAEKINAGFSHSQEFDADISALSLLVAAGYSPHGLIDMLSELAKTQERTRGGFNSTHPTPSSRLVNARVASARYANITDNSAQRQRRFSSAQNTF